MAKDPAFKEEGFDSSICGPTRSSGVYAICVIKRGVELTADDLQVVYIGSSKNVYKRVTHSSHNYRRLFNILKSYDVSTFYKECDNYIELETSLIKKYKPRFNINHV